MARLFCQRDSFARKWDAELEMSEPPTANPTRELAAIMFSDIAGYTLIMGRDEALAMHAVAEHRALLRTLLPKFNGRLLGEIGDGR
jgi:class 3 adenylate cyclase